MDRGLQRRLRRSMAIENLVRRADRLAPRIALGEYAMPRGALRVKPDQQPSLGQPPPFKLNHYGR